MGNRDFEAGTGNSPGHFPSARNEPPCSSAFDRSDLSRRTARKLAGKWQTGLILLPKSIEMAPGHACKAECGRSPVD
jgi:hypothetical protein